MTRFQSSSMQAAAEESVLAFRVLAKIGVTSGYVYFCTGNTHLYFDSATYAPVGGLGSIEPIEEESDVYPRDIRMTLCGINTLAMNGSLSLYEPLRESMANRRVYLYRTFLETAGFTMVDTPELMWSGRISRLEVKPMEGEYVLTASSETKRGAKIQYFNAETMRAVDSSDTFCDLMPYIPLYKSRWGQNAPGGLFGPALSWFIRQQATPGSSVVFGTIIR